MASSWQVTAQSETTGLTPSGTPAKGVNVTFKTADGTSGSVFIPDANYTADNVKAAIAERVAAFDAVKGLTG